MKKYFQASIVDAPYNKQLMVFDYTMNEDQLKAAFSRRGLPFAGIDGIYYFEDKVFLEARNFEKAVDLALRAQHTSFIGYIEQEVVVGIGLYALIEDWPSKENLELAAHNEWTTISYYGRVKLASPAKVRRYVLKYGHVWDFIPGYDYTQIKSYPHAAWITELEDGVGHLVTKDAEQNGHREVICQLEAGLPVLDVMYTPTDAEVFIKHEGNLYKETSVGLIQVPHIETQNALRAKFPFDEYHCIIGVNYIERNLDDYHELHLYRVSDFIGHAVIQSTWNETRYSFFCNLVEDWPVILSL